jgi:hypothetical protein
MLNTPQRQNDRLFPAPPKGLKTTFNPAVSIEIRGIELSGNVASLAVREVDQRLGWSQALDPKLIDPREQRKVRYTMQELIIERVASMANGHPTQDACDKQAHDPAVRAAVWNRPGPRVADERLGSQPTASRLIDALGTLPENLETLRQSTGDLVARHVFAAGQDRKIKTAALDVDAFPIDGFGNQEGLEYNDYYGRKVFLPLVAMLAPHGHYDSPRQGDGFVYAQLYGGLPKTAETRLDFIRRALPAANKIAECVIVRADAEFSTMEEMNGLNEDGQYFVMRHKNVGWIVELGAPYALRPPGRPPTEGYSHVVDLGFGMWNPSWKKPLRVIVCIEDGPEKDTGRLSLFPRVFFLITNVPVSVMNAEELLDFYRQRGTFECRLGEWKTVIGANLSSPALAENDATLQLACIAYNFANILRGELEAAKDPRPDPPANQADGIDLRRFQDEFLKGAGYLERNGRKLVYWLSAGIGVLWLALWGRLERWKPSSRFPVPTLPYARKWVSPPAHSFHAYNPRL